MKLKKNTFVQGAFIATICIVISKILGILYVIPFYHIIGEENGSLYGYAYTVYNLFLMLASIGFPLGMSKIVSEYTALGYFHAKERAYQLITKVSLIVSFVMFLILIVFAPILAELIIGNIKGGDNFNDIVFVIRAISTAILIVPYLAIARGYLQGHKFIAPTGYSQVIEQFIRVIVILVGSYAFLNIFHLQMRYVIGIALLGATIGAFGSLIYILYKIKKNKRELVVEEEEKEEEKNITNKEILRKMLMYSAPFIMISITTSIYEFVDMMTVNRTMVEILGYTASDAKGVVAVLTTWGSKLNSIVQSISTGIITSIIPTITYSFAKKHFDDVKSKINQTIQVYIYVALPLTVLLSLLAEPVFHAFYGANTWGPTVFKFSIFLAFFGGVANTVVIMLQSFNKYKLVFISLLIGALLNAAFNIPLMILVDKLGFYGFYGAILSSIIGYSVSAFIAATYMKKIVRVSYKESYVQIVKILCSIIAMCIVIFAMMRLVPININGRINAILAAMLYGGSGILVYAYFTYRLCVIETVFGNNLIQNVISKFKRKK